MMKLLEHVGHPDPLAILRKHCSWFSCSPSVKCTGHSKLGSHGPFVCSMLTRPKLPVSPAEMCISFHIVNSTLILLIPRGHTLRLKSFIPNIVSPNQSITFLSTVFSQALPDLLSTAATVIYPPPPGPSHLETPIADLLLDRLAFSVFRSFAGGVFFNIFQRLSLFAGMCYLLSLLNKQVHSTGHMLGIGLCAL